MGGASKGNTNFPHLKHLSIDVLKVNLPNNVGVKVEVARKGEPQGNVFGAWEHEHGGYKGLLKYEDTG
jgi:hypothetical protein